MKLSTSKAEGNGSFVYRFQCQDHRKVGGEQEGNWLRTSVGKTLGLAHVGSGRRQCEGKKGRERVTITGWQDQGKGQGAFILWLLF